jgi:hypothetical protein
MALEAKSDRSLLFAIRTRCGAFLIVFASGYRGAERRAAASSFGQIETIGACCFATWARCGAFWMMLAERLLGRGRGRGLQIDPD